MSCKYCNGNNPLNGEPLFANGSDRLLLLRESTVGDGYGRSKWSMRMLSPVYEFEVPVSYCPKCGEKLS